MYKTDQALQNTEKIILVVIKNSFLGSIGDLTTRQRLIYICVLIPRFLSSQSVQMDMGPVQHHSLLQLDPDDPATEIKIIKVNTVGELVNALYSLKKNHAIK